MDIRKEFTQSDGDLPLCQIGHECTSGGCKYGEQKKKTIYPLKRVKMHGKMNGEK
jgi:hypothetical protein